MYLCTDEDDFHDSSSYKWLWQDNDCQGLDGALFIEGLEGATL
jgi:hypothetical protein